MTDDIDTQVKEFYTDVECFPEWEEILELEYARQTGDINMVTDNVTQYCYDHGLLNATSWLMRCHENRKSWIKYYSDAVESFEKEHGHREMWISDELRSSMKKAFLRTELRNKREELDRLEKELNG